MNERNHAGKVHAIDDHWSAAVERSTPSSFDEHEKKSAIDDAASIQNQILFSINANWELGLIPVYSYHTEMTTTAASTNPQTIERTRACQIDSPQLLIQMIFGK